MASYQIVYWRDIPAQIKVGSGRSRVGRQMSLRFQEAIDRAAMRSGLFNTDDYLGEWRTSAAEEREGDAAAVAEAVAAEIEAAYDSQRLEALAVNGGKEA
jgi:hypothetical protein